MNLVMYLWIVSVVAAILFITVVLFMVAMAATDQRQLQTEGIQAKARIIDLEIMNAADRRIPFVRMKLAIQASEPFVTTAEEFYPAEELPYIRIGSELAVVYHPLDKTCRLLTKRFSPRPAASKRHVEPMILPNQKLSAA